MAKNTGKRLEGDAENFYKMIISNIFVLSFALTYSNQLSTSRRLVPLSLQNGKRVACFASVKL
ncbi:MAG: hypothetical protein DBY44_07605 [Veillonellaceae bacterium]|nr:MAG: hypothetical protein DBY44_07605 [Veillonellaceae bacterium]